MIDKVRCINVDVKYHIFVYYFYSPLIYNQLELDNQQQIFACVYAPLNYIGIFYLLQHHVVLTYLQIRKKLKWKRGYFVYVP